MFMAEVSRLRFDHHKNRMFDGKLGIWTFVMEEPAQTEIKNRPSGIMVTKPINVDREAIREMLVLNVSQ